MKRNIKNRIYLRRRNVKVEATITVIICTIEVKT